MYVKYLVACVLANYIGHKTLCLDGPNRHSVHTVKDSVHTPTPRNKFVWALTGRVVTMVIKL